MESKIKESGVSAKICAISWERIHLRMQLAVDQEKDAIPLEKLDVFAVDREGVAGVLFDTKLLDNGRLELYVNITNNGLHKCIPVGTYRIFVCHGNDVLAECETDEALTQRLADDSRAFLYGGQTKEYTVNFYVEDDSDSLPFRMHCMHLSYAKISFPYLTSFFATEKGILKGFLTNTRRHIRKIYNFLYNVKKNKRKNHVLFMTEQSNTLGTNLVFLEKRMRERGLDKQFTIRTWARKFSDGDHGTMSWIKLANLLASSEYVFIDDHVPMFDWLQLKDTKIIQTWHAGAGFKSSGYSRWGHMGGPGPISCHRQYAYGLCGSRKIAHFFSEVWGINTERVLNTGMPRMDEFQDPKHREVMTEKLYEEFPLAKGKKVILFAPTYRGRSNRDAHYPYELIDWKRLDEVCGDEYVVFFKMHPWVIVDIDIPAQYRSKMIDVKKYPNINDLFYITDILITDYSSNIYEYSLMRRPMLFFAFDEIQYSFSRGFHRPYRESAPGKVCTTFDELMDAIEQKDFEFEKVEEYVKTQFDHFDSDACDRVIDWLLLDKMPDDIKDRIQKKDKRMRRIRTTDFSIFVEEKV